MPAGRSNLHDHYQYDGKLALQQADHAQRFAEQHDAQGAGWRALRSIPLWPMAATAYRWSVHAI